MERLEVRCEDAKRAIGTLREVLQEPFSTIVRDASIQRFEYSFEAYWKFIKEYLKIREGTICNSPKSCFREVFTVGIIKEDEAVKMLEMTDGRNMTRHAYREEVAQIIYGKLEEYSRLMEDIIGRFRI